MSLCLLSHLIPFILYLPAYGIYWLIKKEKIELKLISIFVFTTLVTRFIIPLIYNLEFTCESRTNAEKGSKRSRRHYRVRLTGLTQVAVTVNLLTSTVIYLIESIPFYSQLLAMDASARISMKDAAKCDKHCEWQNFENQQNAERILHFWVTPKVCLLQGVYTLMQSNMQPFRCAI